MPPSSPDPALPSASRRLLYTVLTGRYEQLTELPPVAQGGIDAICFTDDRALVSSTWQIRVIEPRFPRDPIRSSRYLKLLGPELLPEYDESLYIDNSVLLRVPPERVLDSWLATADFGVPLHSDRHTVAGEFDAVGQAGYDDPLRLYEQLVAYSMECPDLLQQRPYWNALLARRHTAAVRDTMRLWLDQVLRYSRRDGLSLNYALMRTGLPTHGVAIDNQDSPLHQWPVSRQRKWHVTRSQLQDELRIPVAELVRLQEEVARLRDAASDRGRLIEERNALAEQLSELKKQLATREADDSERRQAVESDPG